MKSKPTRAPLPATAAKRQRFLALLAAATLMPGQLAAQQLLPGERAAAVTAIPGVIAADAKWELIWAGFQTADGIVGTPDGGILFAQEQSDSIRKLDVNGKEFIYLTDTHGAGAVSLDAQGRLFAVQRTCTDSARPFYQSCQELPMVSMLAPERKMLANSFADGKPLGRVNDVMADGKGGAYFTVGGAYYVNASGCREHGGRPGHPLEWHHVEPGRPDAVRDQQHRGPRLRRSS